MTSAYIERHIHALSRAHACIQLGARMRTASHISGLSPSELSKLYLPGERAFHCGRLPSSADWLMDKTNSLMRAELSIFASIFSRIMDQGFAPGDGMVTAYKLYRSTCSGHPRVSFDRAFDVACHLKGLWVYTKISIALYPCPHCDLLNLSSIGDDAPQHHGCVFCRLVVRYYKDQRIRTSFPQRRGHSRSISRGSPPNGFVAENK